MIFNVILTCRDKAPFPFSCDVCEKNFPSKNALRNHGRDRRCPKTTCLRCGGIFSNRAIHQHITKCSLPKGPVEVEGEKEGDGGERVEDGERVVDDGGERGEKDGEVLVMDDLDEHNLGDFIVGELGGVETVLPRVLDSVEFELSAEQAAADLAEAIAAGSDYLEELGL